MAALQPREKGLGSVPYHHDHRRLCPNEIELVQHGGTLLVTGQKGEQPELLHQGIPLSFQQSFSLADHVKVAGANVEHGMLTIDLVREVPEELKARRIEIRAGTEPLAAKQDNEQKQIDASAKRWRELQPRITAVPPGRATGGLMAENGDEQKL